jgi:hypothetical protein
MANTQNINAASGSLDRLVRPRFDEIGFGAGMTATYMENSYAIVAVNFPERLLGLADSPTLHPDDTFWVREENAVIHGPNNGGKPLP